MSGISTHILDTSVGRPAAGITVRLFLSDRELATAVTNKDGRVQSLLPPDISLAAGTYRIVFDVASRWPDGFYPEVSVTFSVKDTNSHYHVPLLISPFGFTTYRGS
jgi:5-hydroxyisourate hydrolase